MSAGDSLVQELVALPPAGVPGSRAPTMGNLKKLSYSHQAMVDLIIQNPWLDQNQLAAHFGYTAAWVSNVMASDAFQSYMAMRREEILDPAIKATVEERFRALVLQSLDRLKGMLETPSCPPQVALRAAELGAKALGIGGHAAQPPPAPPAADRLEKLALRLTNLNTGVNLEIESTEITKVVAAAG